MPITPPEVHWGYDLIGVASGLLLQRLCAAEPLALAGLGGHAGQLEGLLTYCLRRLRMYLPML